MLSDDDAEDEDEAAAAGGSKAYRSQLSFLGELHMHLEAWITPETEQLLRCAPGAAAPPPAPCPESVPEIAKALRAFISLALLQVLSRMLVGAPRGEVDRGMDDLLRTLRLMGALPAFTSLQWQVVVLVLLKALSMARVPSLRTSFETREGAARVGQALAAYSFTEEEFYAVLELLLDVE